MRKLIFSLWFFDEILMNPIRLLHCTHHFGVKLSFAVHLMWPISTPLTCRVGNLNLCDSTFACPGNRPKVARAQGLQEFIKASRSRLGLHPFPIHFPSISTWVYCSRLQTPQRLMDQWSTLPACGFYVSKATGQYDSNDYDNDHLSTFIIRLNDNQIIHSSTWSYFDSSIYR